MTLKDIEKMGDDITDKELEDIIPPEEIEQLEEAFAEFRKCVEAYETLIKFECCHIRIAQLKAMLDGYMEDNK